MQRIAVVLIATLVCVSPHVMGAEGADQTTAHIAAIRAATAHYHDVEKARTAGYMQVSLMVPNMGYHFLNKDIKGMDLYVRQRGCQPTTAGLTHAARSGYHRVRASVCCDTSHCVAEYTAQRLAD